jgi:pyridoxal phosphate enzyme (YggS family)
MPESADIVANLEAVRRRIDAAAQRSGRSPTDITLVAVSKTVPPSLIRAAAGAGQRVFGENRVQEATAKIDALAAMGLEWHLIGHLQSNKARKAAAAFGCIESVDSLDLLHRLDTAAAEAGTRPAVLIQVDLAHEVTKHGADETAARELAEAACEARSLDLRGLMIVPPIPEQPEHSRPWFRRLRDLRDALIAAGIPAASLSQLSMGMSHDFEVAIEEGATMVRVGTALFGRRPAPAGAAAAR